MKKNLVSRFLAPLCAIGAMNIAGADAQVLLQENFATAGALTSNGWTQIGSVTTNPLNSAPPALAYPNLPSSGVGNAASLLNTGQDAYRLLSATETGTIYTSIVVTVSAALTGDYFYAFYNQAASGGGYNGRIFIRSNGSGGFNFGVAKNTATAASVSYETTARSFNTSYLVVMKMTRNAGSATDDVASLWINPALGGSESTPDLLNSVGNDNTIGFTSIALRQGGTADAATLRVGNILVGSTWASVTPSANLPAITPAGGYLPFTTFAGTASATQSIGVGGTNLTAGITATAPAGLQVSSDNVTFGPTANLPSVGGTLYARIPASAPAGEVSSSITLSSTGAADVAVSVTAAVRPNPVVLPYGPETFTTTSFPWYTFTVAGARNWNRVTAGGNSFMEINGYDTAVGAVPANAWLILGPFDFPAASNLVASFNLQRAFNDAGSDAEFTFKYSTDYAGIDNPSSSTWSDIAFAKPAAVPSSSTVFTPSGAVTLPASLAGETGVYLAFQLAATSATATSRWRVDDFEVFTSSLPVVSVVVNPSIINEGSGGTGTVALPAPAAADTDVTVTSADGTLVQVNGGASTVVTIPAGFTSADFDVTTTRDFEVGTDVPVQITAESPGYTFGQTIVTVKNIDLPAVSLTSAGYTQNFVGFTSAALPAGWSLAASNQDYSAWSTTTTGAKYSSASDNVFGYQHTGSTGAVAQILTLKNDTGAPITDIVVSYFGRTFENAGNGRDPSYTVTINDATYANLSYSTAAGDNARRTAVISGLAIAPGQTITISWASDGNNAPGTNTRRQIGISEVSVTIGSAVLPPSISNLSVPLATIGQNAAEVSADVTADGGSIITARGFVYALTSVNPAPEIGGSGVTNLPDATADVGVFNATLSGLSTSTQYSVRAYAINAEGTSYTPARTFTTLGAPIGFTGNYAESFATYTGTLPSGWTALSSTETQAYGGAWGTGSAGGFRGVATNTGAVLGYQHTSTSGTLTVTARFVNDTAAPINTLYVRYQGRVARADQQNQPAWAVSLDGNLVAELAYSTGNTSGPEGTAADELITAAITGLSIPAGAEFDLTWVSDRGTQGGTSRQIGLADFLVSTSEIGEPSINVTGSLTPFSATEGSPSAAQSFSASGTGLIGNITVTAPANYEVSLDNSIFSASVTLTPTGGSLSATPVYVRIAATAPVGNPAGQVSLSSTAATTQNIAVTGTVSSAASAYDTWAGGFGLDPATNGAPAADPDGDSFTNEEEYAFGTNPTVANGSLLTTTASGGNFVVTWLERSDVTYNVQSTTNLAATAFANDGSVTVQAGPAEPAPPAGYTRKQFSVPTTGNKFYRVSATVPNLPGGASTSGGTLLVGGPAPGGGELLLSNPPLTTEGAGTITLGSGTPLETAPSTDSGTTTDFGSSTLTSGGGTLPEGFDPTAGSFTISNSD